MSLFKLYYKKLLNGLATPQTWKTRLTGMRTRMLETLINGVLEYIYAILFFAVVVGVPVTVAFAIKWYKG